MKKRVLLLMFAAFALSFLSRIAYATTYSIPAGIGTLTYNVTVYNATCQYILGAHVYNFTYNQSTYSSFSFSYSGGGTANLLGSASSIYDPEPPPVGNKNCPKSSDPQVTLTAPQVSILFTPSATTGGSAIVGTVGWANPKYKIIGVEYAPPGSKSSVTYGANTVVGTSTGVMSTFSSQDQQSVTTSAGFSIFGFGSTETSTYSNDYTQEKDTSSSVAVTQTTSSSTGLSGYADPINGINHDYDYIFVWLNPIANFVIYPQANGNLVTWTGYGYDLNDTRDYPDMDLVGVQLGCLNGDFYAQYTSGTNTNWLTCETVFNTNFNRSCALNNTDGSGPGLTPSLATSVPPYNFCQHPGKDLYYICLADPYSNPSYKLAFPSGSTTTTDGRFTACNGTGCTTTIDYEPNLNTNYSQGYSTTTTTGQMDKYTYKQSFSLESKFSATEGSGKTFSATFTQNLGTTNTYTWTDQFNQTTNNSKSQTASFAIVGPAEGYVGPTQFVVYQDNLYGTFMFSPGN